MALHLIAELCARKLNAQHATGSRAFTKTLHKVVGSRASAQFRFFHNYARHVPDSIDVLVLDEAHRIRATSNHRYTPKHARSELPQVEELVRVANRAKACTRAWSPRRRLVEYDRVRSDREHLCLMV